MNRGVLLALSAYAVFAWGDGIIKGLAGQIGVFEIAFYANVFTGAFMYFNKPAGERWRDFWRTSRPWAVHFRAFGGLVATLLCVYAFTTIPLAETYALLFVAPLFVTMLSVVVLKEPVGMWRWLAVVAGFAGVLLVVQPGFRELELGHFAAIAAAFVAAMTMILIRSLAANERRTAVFGTMIAYGVIANGVILLAIEDGIPEPRLLAIMALIGLLATVGHTSMFKAAQISPAAQIAPTHYSQIIWAVLIGATFYEEYPDWISFIGLAVITASGLLTLVRERIRLGTVRWTPFFRNRL